MAVHEAKSSDARVAAVFSVAWIGVVAAAYAGFLGDRGRSMPAWALAICFACGVLFAAASLLGCYFKIESSPARMVVFYVLASATVVVALLTSGLPGSFGILALPLVSQATFHLRWPGVALVTAGLYGATLGAYQIIYGHVSLSNTALPYGSAFLFTVLLSIAGRHAFAARAQAEQLSQELTEANARLRDQADHADELATTRERNRLAREIHDGLGHYLTVIKVQLDAASATLHDQPDIARRSLDTAARLAAEALDDVRRSVGTLRSETTRAPLQSTLQNLADQAHPVAAVRIEGLPRTLSPAVEHALFRAAQEGLTNVSKHARATHAVLRLDFRTPGQVRLEIEDDGRGTESTTATVGGAPGGFGIAGLRERFAPLGGRIDLRTRPDGGCVLTAEVPA